MKRVALWLGATVLTGAVHAADKPVMAPPGAWVKPMALPATDPKLGTAAVRVLLMDQQVRLSPQGDEVYAESAMRIETPQGLAAMGSITLPWKPETMTLTVHKLHVVRDGKVIDLLANGREFIVLRRENDLEHAVLDGMLTATLQPEGLQVGDIVDMAFTLKNLDPSLRGVSQGGLGGLPLVPIDHVRTRALWASDLPIKWRPFGDLPTIKETRAGGLTEIGYTADNVQPPVLPRGAPLRYAMTRTVQITGLADWPALSTLFAPLYVKAATIGPDSPLQGELARIRAASPDPARRAELALALVQDQVRYVLLGMADGNLVPASADQTWQRRFGDCKGKTALLLGLLHGLGIEAEPALVSARLGDGLDERLPMVGLFDHVIVRATIGGKVYWLDGTRTGDRRLADIDVPPFRWALPVRLDKGATLERLEVQPPTKPFVATTIRIDASKGESIAAPAHLERRWRGDGATAMKLAVANLTPDARERELKNYWRGEYAMLEPDKVDARFDETTGEELLTVDGSAKLDWSGYGYQAEGSAIGYDADFSRDAGPNRDAPFAVGFPMYVVTHEEVVLPNGGKGYRVSARNVDTIAAGTAFRRQGRIENGVFVADTSTRSVMTEFPAKDAAAAQATIRGFKLEGLYVQASPKSAAVASPVTAAQFADRALQRLASDRAGARQDALRAVELDAKAAGPLGVLAALDFDERKFASARSYADRALALDPHDPRAAYVMAVAVLPSDAKEAERLAGIAVAASPQFDAARAAHAGALLAQGRSAEAMAEINTLIAERPDFAGSYSIRATAYRMAGDNEKALADLEELTRRNPLDTQAYVDRSNIYRSRGDKARAIAEGAALSRARPDDAHAQNVAAIILANMGEREAADAAFVRSLLIKPDADTYLNRSTNRPKEDHAGRRADIDEALKLQPDSAYGINLLSREQTSVGDHRGAVATLSGAIARWPDKYGLFVVRGVALARAGDLAGARRDVATVREHLPQASALLNQMCYELATNNVLLVEALALCDDALKVQPRVAAILDSRAFVLLRLQRYGEAVSAYDAALQQDPKMTESLFGRALAQQHLGKRDAGAADIAAAKAIDPHVAESFAGYGLTS